MPEERSDAELVEAARLTLEAHRRGVEGLCVACRARFDHLVRHPCGYAQWAANIAGRAMTVAFLGLPAREPGQHDPNVGDHYAQVTVYPAAHTIWRRLRAE